MKKHYSVSMPSESAEKMNKPSFGRKAARKKKISAMMAKARKIK